MANVLAELFKNTANAIREKTGESGKMKPAEFPEKIRAIEASGGSGEAELESLIVTENGIYHPKESLEIGGTYTLRNDYTQEELQALFEASLQTNSDDTATYAFLHNGAEDMLGIMLAYGFYGVYISDGHLWLPAEFAGEMGFTSGWNFGTDIMNLTPAGTPARTFGETDTIYTEGGISSLASLFDLRNCDGFSVVGVNVNPTLEELTVTANGIYEPTESDGYSKVTVNVQSGGASGGTGERNVIIKTGSYTVSSETEQKTIEHGLGVIPDMFIFRIVGTIPSTTKAASVFGGTFLAPWMVGETQGTFYFTTCYNTSRSVTNGGGTYRDYTQSGSYDFIQGVTATHFTVGGISDRHQTGLTYYWTAFGNLLA